MVAAKARWSRWGSVALFAVVFIGLQVIDPFHADCTVDGKRCQRDGDGWKVEGKDLEGAVTIRIESGDHLVLRDVRIRDAKDVSIEVLCSCDVRGENFTIDGTEQTRIHLTGADSWRGTPTPDVSFHGLVARGIGGFHASMLSGEVTLGDLHLACPSEDSGFGIDAPPGTVAIRLSDVEVEGCNGFSYADGRDRDNDNAGLEPVPLELVRVRMKGFGPVYTGHNMGIGGPAYSAFALTVVDSSIMDFDAAIDVQEGASVILRNSTLANSEHGISLSEGGKVVVERSSFTDNRYGIRVWGGSSVQVTDSSFLRNGRVPFSGSGDCGGAIFGSFAGFVHGSIFQGNTIAVEGGLGLPPFSLFDATGNYWGASSGPVPHAFDSSPGLCVPTSPAGDQVGAGVNYTPFLTAPPG